MARLYDPTDGTVTFGGIDLRDASVTSLRTQHHRRARRRASCSPARSATT
jgi:ABC-type iron transport system FetAB ATPase subunit